MALRSVGMANRTDRGRIRISRPIALRRRFEKIANIAMASMPTVKAQLAKNRSKTNAMSVGLRCKVFMQRSGQLPLCCQGFRYQ